MRKTDPTLEALAAAMIAAGWPYTATAQKLGLSLSTVKRIGLRAGAVRGEAHAELMEAARDTLREALTAEYAAIQGAALVRSQAVNGKELQAQIAETLAALATLAESDEINPAAYQQLHQRAKILTTLATASKLGADGLRGALSLAASPDNVEELPVLEVRDMTEEEIAILRAQQRADAIAMGIITEEEEDEPEPQYP